MRPSFIIIGPDGVGKTTIAGELSRATGIPTFKFPGEKMVFREGQNGALHFDLGLTFFLEQTGSRFIGDRGYPCEWVYAKVFGRPTDIPLLERIDASHEYIGTQLVYLYSSVVPDHEDDLVPADRYWEVKRTYDAFCEWTSCRVVAYDTAGSRHLTGKERALHDTRRVMELVGLELF